MSGVTAMTVMAAAAVAGTVVSIKNGIDQKKAAENSAKQQQAAQQQAQANAAKQESAADQANNAANRKSPDTTALLSAASQSGRSGQSGTMLTGPQGVGADELKLGRNSLLGQ